MEDTYHLGIKALIQNEKGQLLLLKVNPAVLSGKKEAYWDIPGGRVQRGSTVDETLRRELVEETGITSVESTKPFAMVLSNIRIPAKPLDFGLILGAYICKVGQLQEIRISEEHTEYGWFSPKEAAELLKVKYPIDFTDKISAIR